ncbi:adaptor complexes medium subunit family protein [Cyclospora cayetanensis]|uniref:Adaptor complexes medium subunit family protein n=1 Tax=Cyclospora cayetanensis TaxID=88456 RepID=A0A1D3CVG8_9EIME|nr:adaptor complexes medium subunit family protein [Cyclospora cayetanensis]
MFDALYFLNSRGTLLLSQSFGVLEVPAAHLAAFRHALFPRLYIQSAPPVVCVGDAKDKTTFFYVSIGAAETLADQDLTKSAFVGLEACLRRTDVALRMGGSGGLVAAAACRGNPNATMAFELLRRLLLLLQECTIRSGASPIAIGALGRRRSQGNLTESFLLSHADLVYELLDEAIDRGIPQTSDPKVLLLFAEAISGLRSAGGPSVQADTSEGASRLVAQATGVTPWRPAGIRHRKNELIIDVVEKLHVLVAQSGSIIRQEVEGKVIAQCSLSGMPECKIVTNEIVAANGKQKPKVQAITNAPLPGTAVDATKSVHGSVSTAGASIGGPQRPSRPSGHDVLCMSKLRTVHIAAETIRRCDDCVKVPIKLCPFYFEKRAGRFEYLVYMKAQFSPRIAAKDVEVIVPTPPEASRIFIPSMAGWGKMEYDSSQLAVVWKIPKFPGGHEYSLRFVLEVYSPPSPVRGPLRLSFSLPGFTASGFYIRQLRVTEKANYSASRTVSYYTESGQYELRI